MGDPSAAVVVFARAPRAGRVKRRLIPALGAGGAASLYRRMTARTVETAGAAAVGPVELWCTPTTEHEFFDTLASGHRIDRFLQAGTDLGARMEHAFTAALARHRAVILVGTDCPSLEVGDLRAAAAYLAGGGDAVVGPAADGGYVLLGLGRVGPSLFRDIEWGGERVFAVTARRLDRLGWRWRALRTLRDIDRPDDLPHLPAGLRAGHPGFSAHCPASREDGRAPRRNLSVSRDQDYSRKAAKHAKKRPLPR